jgi:hypothetical protein
MGGGEMKVRVCVYDSPDMRRECWENGKMIYAIQAFVLCQKGGPGFPIFFGANIGPWKTGQIVGDPKAMDKWEEGK